MISILREPKKRKRNGINKRWTSEEIRCILNYLENSTAIEVPTAQIFYRKFLLETGIDATWDIVRWKVKNLKNTYKKAMAWSSSTEARSLEQSEGTDSVNARVLRICPQFRQLNNIFGESLKTQISWHEIIDNGGPVETASIKIDAEETDEMSDIFKLDHNNESSGSLCGENENYHTDKSKFSSQKSSTSNIGREFAGGPKKSYPKVSFSYLADFQAQKRSLFEMKLEWERKKHMDEMEINRKKFALDEEKTKAEIELKKHELELKTRDLERKSALQEEKIRAEINFKKQELELREREIERDERLKIMEIEKDERLKKYEIEMKLKNRNKEP